jgi:hypothetical protein
MEQFIESQQKASHEDLLGDSLFKTEQMEQLRRKRSLSKVELISHESEIDVISEDSRVSRSYCIF